MLEVTSLRFNKFPPQFLEKVHNLKEIVNIQGLFVLIVVCLFVSVFSFLLFLCTVLWRYKRDYLHVSRDNLFYIMFYVINMMKKHSPQKRSQFDLYKSGF